MTDYPIQEKTIDVKVGEEFDIWAQGGVVHPGSEKRLEYPKHAIELVKEEYVPDPNLGCGPQYPKRYTLKALDAGTFNVESSLVWVENWHESPEKQKVEIEHLVRYIVNATKRVFHPRFNSLNSTYMADPKTDDPPTTRFVPGDIDE